MYMKSNLKVGLRDNITNQNRDGAESTWLELQHIVIVLCKYV